LPTSCSLDPTPFLAPFRRLKEFKKKYYLYEIIHYRTPRSWGFSKKVYSRCPARVQLIELALRGENKV
jgi:hypothetical protein